MTADDIIAAARSQLGVIFLHQGRIPGKFLDCAGLAAYVAQSIGVEYNEWPGYGRLPHKGLLEKVMDAQPALVKVKTRQPGDILLIRFGREPQHLAIFTGDTIIHSYEVVNKICEHQLDPVWEKRIVAIYRFKNIQGPALSGVEKPVVSEAEL